MNVGCFATQYIYTYIHYINLHVNQWVLYQTSQTKLSTRANQCELMRSSCSLLDCLQTSLCVSKCVSLVRKGLNQLTSAQFSFYQLTSKVKNTLTRELMGHFGLYLISSKHFCLYYLTLKLQHQGTSKLVEALQANMLTNAHHTVQMKRVGEQNLAFHATS